MNCLLFFAQVWLFFGLIKLDGREVHSMYLTSKQRKRTEEAAPPAHGELGVMDSLDGSVARDTPSELSFSPLVVSVYFVWGFIFLLIVLLLCVIGLMPVASQQR